jgi:CRISPR/Cas system endoribonuclease Cas6 (RAMP superfamily)
VLLSLVIRMAALSHADYPGGGGQLTHAAALDLIAASDRAAAQSAHDRVFPITTSGLRMDGSRPLSYVAVTPGDEAWMRVTVIGRPAAMAMLESLGASQVELDIGRARFAVTGVALEPLHCGNPTTVDSLLEQAGAMSCPMSMAFTSPTHFARRGIWLALPTPETVFGHASASGQGLVEHWTRAGGAGLGDFNGAFLGARIISHQACVARVHARHRPADAFMGVAEYTADSDAHRRAMWALGFLAQFAGVGASRSMGMGQVAVSLPK